MPAIEVDVNNIPDIIEAQLTLSYSRLSDLIRVIIEQGNTHEDDLLDVRTRLRRLEDENDRLRADVDHLKAEKGRDTTELDKAVSDLQKAMEEMNQQVTEQAKRLEEGEVAQQQAAAAQEEAAAAAASAAEEGANTATQIAAVEQNVELLKAFYNLWGATPEKVFAMVAPDEEDPGEFEHSIEERTKYLHTLPAFANLMDEIDVVRGVMQKQAADALAARGSADQFRNSRANSERLSSSAAEVADGAECGDINDRVARLEERLNVILGHARNEDGSVTNPGLVDVASRLSNIEDIVNGFPEVRSPTTTNSVTTVHGPTGGEVEDRDARNSAAASTGVRSPVGKLPGASDAMSPTTPAVAGSPMVDAQPAGSLAAGEVASPTSTAAAAATAAGGEVGADGADGAAGAAGADGAPGMQASSVSVTVVGGVGAVPMVAAGESTGSILQPSPQRLPPLSAAQRNVVTVSAPSPTRTEALSRTSSARRIEQPHVDALRREEQSGTATNDQRRISVAVAPDEGLVRRVGQLEENTAILEVNKADRRELQILEETVRQMLQQGSGYTPHRPGTSPSGPPSGNTYPQNVGPVNAAAYMTAPPARYSGDLRNRVAQAGRPLFVGSGSSVNLRDGANMTSATIYPARPAM